MVVMSMISMMVVVRYDEIGHNSRDTFQSQLWFTVYVINLVNRARSSVINKPQSPTACLNCTFERMTGYCLPADLGRWIPMRKFYGS